MQSKNLKSGAGCGFRWLILLIVVMVICESALAGKTASKKKDNGPAKASKKTGAGGKECRQACAKCSCSNQYRPVCANNGRIYPNICRFECAKKCGNPNLKIQREGSGPCEEVPCYPFEPPCKKDLSDKDPSELVC